MIRAAIYCRISIDDDGDALGVERQEQDCRALCASRGWEVVEVYVDNDVSASRYSRRPRPEFDRMLADVDAGALDAIVAYDQDRLVRRPRELEDLFDRCDRAGLRLFATVSGDTDLATADGQFKARILGAVAAKESDNISRRVRRKHRELAERGLPSGGPRWFGWKPGNRELDPCEAGEIRRMADLVLAGANLTQVVDDLIERGVPTARGGTWSQYAVRSILIAPRIAGLRSHRGEIVGRGVWEPIVDEETLIELRRVLLDPTRRTRRRHPRYDYLLTGLMWCGLCGHRLYQNPRTRQDGKRDYRYHCLTRRGGCNRVGISAPRADALVSELVAERLRRPEFAPPDDGTEAVLLAELRVEEEALTQLARDHYGSRIIGRDEYLAARAVVEERAAYLRARLANHRALARASAGRNNANSSSAEFAGAPIEVRREIIRLLIQRITVAPFRPGRGGFDPDRIEVTWLR